ETWVLIGSEANDITEIPKSYEEVKKAFKWVKEFRPVKHIYKYDELALLMLLSKMKDLPESKGVWKRYWEPLELDQNKSKRTISLKNVMTTMIRNDFNAKQSASDLHIHYNTMRNYISEIEEILKIDCSKRLHKTALDLCFFMEQNQ
nr:helix-turn-helix domain-containing protein [Synergistales bacterium]